MPQIATGLPHLRIGFLPLNDAAPLVVADRLGLFARRGLRVSLHPAGAWAALRDRLLHGALDGAHLLYPMPIAAALGAGQARHRLRVACGLGRNGNTLTLSHDLAGALGLLAPPVAPAAFAVLARQRAAAGRRLRLGIVHAFSTHGYLLRQWLADAGLDPERDVALEVVPPPLMGPELASGALDGFCAGEPWGSQAVLDGAGRVALGSGSIWPDHPEKLLVVTAAAEARAPEAVVALTAAVIEAAEWLDAPGHAAEAAALMAPVFPGLDPRAVAAAFKGTVPLPDGGAALLPHPLRFAAATRPDPAHARRWLGEMRRWGHLPEDAADAAALAPFADDLWACAAALPGRPVAAPALSSLPEA